MAHIAQQSELVINTADFFGYPTIEGSEVVEFALYRAMKRGYLFDAIFAVDLGDYVQYRKVLKVERKKEPEHKNETWLTFYFSNNEERYMSTDRTEKFDKVIAWEQSRPNDAE